MKTCSMCHQSLSLDHYNIQRSAKDGHQAYCRPCAKVNNDKNRTPEKRKANYYKNHKENLAYQQEWRDAHRDQLRIRSVELNRERRLKVFNIYGNKCECCGESTFEFLAIDHVNGDGIEERKLFGTQQLVMRIIKSGKQPNYRLLCHNCNLALGIYKYCPHMN